MGFFFLVIVFVINLIINGSSTLIDGLTTSSSFSYGCLMTRGNLVAMTSALLPLIAFCLLILGA